MPLYEFEGKHPRIDPSAWIAPSADLIGDVQIGPNCYVGWGAILRADHGSIVIGQGSAVEEGVIMHTSAGFVSQVGREVTIGHGAMLHGATIGDFAVVGMRATIGNYGQVGEWAIIGEMGLLASKQIVPAGVIAVGQPVKVIGPVQERHKKHWLESKKRYQAFCARNKNGLRLLPDK
jgi:carbonic anhydrase/acetyltransferase-like protein (isoleucine patch superfamily)